MPTNTFQRKTLLDNLQNVKEKVEIMLLDSCQNEHFECIIIRDLLSVKSISRKEIVFNSKSGQIVHRFNNVNCIISPL